MTDLIEPLPKDESGKPHIIVVLGGHNPLPPARARRLMMLAAMQMIRLAGREDIAEKEQASLDPLAALVLERHGGEGRPVPAFPLLKTFGF